MEFNPYCITVRLKGMRQRYEISPAGVYNIAVRMAVEKARVERKKKRSGRLSI
jgi:hypothetical protein